ncbi:MAG TPA: inositol monophosphatase family protein, partial [Egicoccus sp.]
MTSAFGPDQLTDLVRFAHELADLADAVTLPGFRDGFAPGVREPAAVDRKADGTAVTAFDREAERVVRAAVRDRYPEHAFLGEEDGLTGATGLPTWIVDPIDGTTNFVTGNPVWATL